MTVVDLGYTPRPWQRRVHLGLASKRWGVLVCHRRAGKTVLAVMTLIHQACSTKKTHARYAYIAPQLKQSKTISWGYLKQFALKIPGAVANESELHVTLPNGAQLRCYGADNADALRGIYLDGVVLDELSQLSKELWDSVLRPALADRKGWALLMGTPYGVNLLSETYFAAQANPDWYSGVFTVNDTDALPADEVASLKREMTPSAFAREMLCDFSAAVDNTLLSVHEVQAASRRHYDEGHYIGSPRIVGVDVARQGDDRTVILGRQGLASFVPKVFRNLDAMTVAGHVAQIILEWEPDAVFIDGSGGYGAGVIDRLKQLRHRCTEVQFGGASNDDRFANKRAEMWFKMAEWVKAGGAIAPSEGLKLDLCTPTYSHDTRGRLLLEAKEAIKKRGMASPDEGDALALTFAFPVAQRALTDALAAAERKPYDPLARVRSYGT